MKNKFKSIVRKFLRSFRKYLPKTNYSFKNLLSKYGYKKYKIIYKPFYAINESLENANLVFYYG